MQKSLLAYKWLLDNPDELLFFNPDGSNTGQYDEAEDISNRFWAACALYEATSDGKYYSDAQELKNRLEEFDKYAQKKGYQGNVFTCLGWAEVAGLGSLSLLLKREENALCSLARNSFVAEADRLVKVSKENGFGLCMGGVEFYSKLQCSK